MGTSRGPFRSCLGPLQSRLVTQLPLFPGVETVTLSALLGLGSVCGLCRPDLRTCAQRSRSSTISTVIQSGEIRCEDDSLVSGQTPCVGPRCGSYRIVGARGVSDSHLASTSNRSLLAPCRVARWPSWNPYPGSKFSIPPTSKIAKEKAPVQLHYFGTAQGAAPSTTETSSLVRLGVTRSR